jgi:hypothetical protein
MKKLLFLLAFVALKVSAQDILTFKNGDVQYVKIIEVSPTEVRYKMFNNLEGPFFIERRSNLHSVKYQNGEIQKFSDSEKTGGYYSDYYSSELETQIVYTKQIDLYIQNGWGAGLLFRKEINPFVGWNIVGVSFMSGWNDPKEFGIVNVRLFGFRLYTPSISSLRFYAELNPGYTHVFLDTKTQMYGYLKGHFFGLDFSAGLQLNKNFALGYNLNYMVNKNGHAISHWGRLSFMF